MKSELDFTEKWVRVRSELGQDCSEFRLRPVTNSSAAGMKIKLSDQTELVAELSWCRYQMRLISNPLQTQTLPVFLLHAASCSEITIQL